LNNIWHELREGWHIFVSTTAVSFYTTSNTFILGLLTNNLTVGYYSAAEKLIISGQRLLNPVAQSIYPYISKLVSDSKDRALLFIKKIIILFGGGSFILSMVIFVLSGSIVEIILGSQFHESIAVLRILAFLPFVIFLSNIFAIQGLVNFNFSNVVSKIAIRGGVLNLILAPIFIYLFKQIGLAISVLIVESFITLQGAYYFNKLIVKEESI
jgi:PST family polysaccharide transporter